ncbi:hypothetical protein KTO58_05550 [Chitinophaga pendula]|uniref:hypothetical protein n=1 Tax=Chitinophaga TaxID=79328 RepID=UPI000BB03B91|nr:MULTISPECIES: hypothetical protein [Chitinophaga]ASZ13729.1 hypothetical protein CK934_23620 [Chitinophaga sp. MD30]UCJ08652.1 hypothetical protein KTO58_05550 [Chitinophaga pendula]
MESTNYFEGMGDAGEGRREEQGKPGRRKRTKMGQPSKPGNWKSLGIRQKNDPLIDSLPLSNASFLKSERPFTADATQKNERKQAVVAKQKVKKKNANVDRSNSPAGTIVSVATEYEKEIKKYLNQFKVANDSVNIPKGDSPNIIDVLHKLSEHIVIRFRDKVILECNWSLPTYYRKLHPGTKFSNAEKEMIATIAEEQLVDLNQNAVSLIHLCRPGHPISLFLPEYNAQVRKYRAQYHKVQPGVSVANAPNVLYSIHKAFEGMACKQKNDVMEQCQWSNNTYYRKQQPYNVFSNAVIEMVGTIIEVNLQDFNLKIAELVGMCLAASKKPL